MSAPLVPAAVDSDAGTITFAVKFHVASPWVTDGCLAAALCGDMRRFLQRVLNERETIADATAVTFDAFSGRTIGVFDAAFATET